MMKHLIIFCGLVVFVFGTTSPVLAQDAQPKGVMAAFNDYCVGALNAKTDIADYAIQKKLAELSPEDSKKFSPDGGRVFVLPNLNGLAVLTTNPNFKSVCGIVIHKIDASQLKKQIFGSFMEHHKFRLLKEKRSEKEKVTRFEFSGDVSGPIKVLISSSDSPRPNGIQVLMTIGRVE